MEKNKIKRIPEYLKSKNRQTKFKTNIQITITFESKLTLCITGVFIKDRRC